MFDHFHCRLKKQSYRMNAPTIVRQMEEQKVRGIGRFFVMMSKCFILPICINKNMTVLKFNFFSMRTLLSFAISSVPLAFSILWNCVVRADFLQEYIEATLRAYITFDCYFLLFYTASQITPFTTQLCMWIASQAYVALPEITTNKKLMFPYKKKYVISTLILKFIASFLVVLGNFLTVSPQLTKFSNVESFINIFIFIFLPWISNSCYIFLMMLLLFTLIDNLCRYLSNIPSTGIESWGWKQIALCKKYQSVMNAPTLTMILIG